MREQWRPIEGYEGQYEVSDKGRVRSWKPGPKRNGKILSEVKSSYHPKVNLSKDGVVTQHCIHVLVAAAFLGPTPKGLVVFHKDHNPKNAAAKNLEFRGQGEWSKK